MDSAKKILYISQSFPPRPGVAGRRLRFLAERAVVDYAEVHAIRLDRDFTGETVAGVSVSAIPARDLRSWLGGNNAGGTIDQATEPGWRRWLRKLRQAFPFLLFTDDGGYLYRRAAYRLGLGTVAAEGITTIFSSFRPWSDHLVARRLKRRYPELRWIADFRDLPVDPVRNDNWWPALQTWWGKRVIRTADEVWCVSRGQAAQLTGWHPGLRVVYNPLLALPPERTAPVTERFTIVYTGSLYPGLQSLAPLVKSLDTLLGINKISSDKFRLIYRGKDAAVFRKWTAGLPVQCLDVQPSVAPAAAQEMQRNAQLLLLLNWSAEGYYGVLTAKLWDYLAAGRPVLALVNGPGDEELEEIIQGADAGAVFGPEKQRELEAWLAGLYEEWTVNGVLPWSPNLPALTSYLHP